MLLLKRIKKKMTDEIKRLVAQCTERFDPASVTTFKKNLFLVRKYKCAVNIDILHSLFLASVFARHFVWDTEFFHSDDNEGNPDSRVNSDLNWVWFFRVWSYDWSEIRFELAGDTVAVEMDKSSEPMSDAAHFPPTVQCIFLFSDENSNSGQKFFRQVHSRRTRRRAGCDG